MDYTVLPSERYSYCNHSINKSTLINITHKGYKWYVLKSQSHWRQTNEVYINSYEWGHTGIRHLPHLAAC